MNSWNVNEFDVWCTLTELQDVTNASFQFRYEEYVGTGAQECSTIYITRVRAIWVWLDSRVISLLVKLLSNGNVALCDGQVKPTNDDLTLLLECTQNISDRELNIDVIGRTLGKVRDAFWLDRDAKRDFSFSPVITTSGIF